VFQYLGSLGLFGDPLVGLNEAQRAAAESIPPAIIAAFPISTCTGLIGGVCLLLRRRWAWPALLVSLLAVAVLEGYVVFLSGAVDAFGGMGLPLTVTTVAALLALTATHAKRQGWLR
jgi:peptidoglycan/LPS O-acetylase OafA/YrhL